MPVRFRAIDVRHCESDVVFADIRHVGMAAMTAAPTGTHARVQEWRGAIRRARR